MLDKDRIKESLSKNDVVRIMEDLGTQLQKEDESKGFLIFQTVCHNLDGEGSNKLYYYNDSKQFQCYTGCGSMDIYSLVVKSKGLRGQTLTFPQAVEYVAKISGKKIEKDGKDASSNPDIIDDWSFLMKYKKVKEKRKSEVTLKEYDKSIFKYFMSLPHISWIEEGISWKSQKKYGIVYDWRSDKIVIPHYDEYGRLVGIRGRALKEEEVEAGFKYMPLYFYGESYPHSLGANLYGLYENREAIQRLKKIIVFEGEKSVIKCQDYLGENNCSVAVCGSNITTIQKDILIGLGVKDIYIALDKEYLVDGDIKSQVQLEKIQNIAFDLAPYCSVRILWDSQGILDEKDSPADKGKDVFLQLMQTSLGVETKKISVDGERVKEEIVIQKQPIESISNMEYAFNLDED